MNDPREFFHTNEEGRPAFIAVGLPVCHTYQDYPFHLFGNPLYKAPDSYQYKNNTKFRKYAPSKFLEYIIGDDISKFEAHSRTLTDLWSTERVSLIIHKGAVRHCAHDGNTFGNIQAGTGPKYSPDMNHSGAHVAWNGIGSFPKYVPGSNITY
jgi:hypothetical protein